MSRNSAAQKKQSAHTQIKQPTRSSSWLEELHADNLAQFTQTLEQSRLWTVLSKSESHTEKADGFLFDTETGLLYSSVAELEVFLKQNSFVFLRQGKNTKDLATLDTGTRLLWNNDSSDAFKLIDGKSIVGKKRWLGIQGWQLPSKSGLMTFAKNKNNPHRRGREYRLAYGDDNSTFEWLTSDGRCDIDEGCWGIERGMSGRIFACHTLWAKASTSEILTALANEGWQLASAQGDVFQPRLDTCWKDFSLEALLKIWAEEGVIIRSVNNNKFELRPAALSPANQLTMLDYTPCRLPELDYAQLTDPQKGLWELWGESTEQLKKYKLVARDPDLDLQNRSVAIDFGTSSTVVAMDTPSGERQLLRIGVRDFYEVIQARQFENPTVLEFLDFNAFEDAWKDKAYRPDLTWDWTRTAHEAQASFRDNPGDTAILASILPRLKQWVMRPKNSRTHLVDRKGRKVQLAAHVVRNPVRGQPLTVSIDTPFDPIELYAWYLGMAINWRGRGLFLKYYLSFPAKYPLEVKDRILASFRCGLQRSLPQTLITHSPELLNTFAVEELASEPAAYAAAALHHLNIEPTDAGVPYAVFDFGGGTADFDFGLFRWATDGEDDDGYEQVLEQLASSGDNYLGGENLIELMVYETFQKNLDVLRQQRVQFTLPLGTEPFVGSEAFLAETQAAQTNSVMLATKLRSFLESDDPSLESQVKLDLLDAYGDTKPCELALNADELDELLLARMRRGAEAFLVELARQRDRFPTDASIHLLLAGNGSRSRHINALFDTEKELWQELLEKAFGESWPEIEVHDPLPMDEARPHAPTAKTGVALGLLRLAPGENTLLINHTNEKNDGQAPFTWFVGRLRRGKLKPALEPGANYGQWQPLGAIKQGVFNLYLSNSPRAYQGLSEGDPELKKQRLDFAAASDGDKLFARAVAPHELELTTGQDEHSLDENAIEPLLLK